MQSELALFYPLAYPGKSHQVIQRNQYGLLFAGTMARLAAGTGKFLLDFFACGLGYSHPGGNEGIVLGHDAFQQRVNTAALRMAEHDDVLHGEIAHTKFKRRTGAVIMPLVFCGRNQIGNVANHEKVAGRAIEYQSRIDTRIATAYHQRGRRLAKLHQVVKLCIVIGE